MVFSCSGIKKLPPGEKLYTGAKIEIIYSDKIKNKKEILTAAKTVLKPTPNKKFLGMRPKLWANLIAGNQKKKGFKNWLKQHGEAPVLITDVNPLETTKLIEAKLFNIGILNANTEYKVVEKKQSAYIIYTCRIHKPFTIKEFQYSITDQNINNIILSDKAKSLLKKDDNYNLETLKKERERIDALLKDNGYFFFNPDYLIFKADTFAKDKKVRLQLLLKEEVPPKALNIYTINNVFVFADYALTDNTDSLKKNKIIFDSVFFIGKKSKVKPAVILESIKLNKNSIYSRKNHNITLNRLMTLGAYKFVRIQFSENDSTSKNQLDIQIFLTPLPKRTLRSEINLISKSNDFVGPQFNVNHLDRNALNGAEILSLNFGGSFETQISGKYKNLYSYSFSSKAELLFPRFIVPFKLKNVSSFYVPKTKLSFTYNYLKRISYFDLRSLQFVYGFKWKEVATKEHELNPVNINFTSIANRSPEFNSLLESNPFVKKSYEQQFIAGAVYSYLYNEQILTGKKHQLYFNITTETSGNTFSLIRGIAGDHISESDPARIAGYIYSQFFKISLDLRNYVNFKKNKLVWRLFTGVGKAYGNSSTLPYIKQYFSGGPNSIRAFAINSIGPGTQSLQGSGASIFLQQGGDIKYESNIEYRFAIYKSLKGAVFTDAGNIWLFKSNPALNGDPFSFFKFYKELAVGAGIGLRVDISFFVLRFDLATPLCKPWLSEDHRWVINRIKPGDGLWRSDNLILNVAIGYPF